MKRDRHWFVELIETSKNKRCAAVWAKGTGALLAAQDVVSPGDLIRLFLKLMSKYGSPATIETDRGETCQSINRWASAHGISIIVRPVDDADVLNGYRVERERYLPASPDPRSVSGTAVEDVFSYLNRRKIRSRDDIH